MLRKAKPLTEAEAYNKFSAQCALAEYCRYDIRKKLKRADADESLIDKVLNRLIKEGFIDEARYARAFVRDKFRYNRWGAQRIQHELRMKGIDQSLIDEALEEISDDDSFENLHHVIQKKLPSVKGRNSYEIKMKLMRFAISRGFDMDTVRRVIDAEMSVGDGIDD